VKVLQVTHQRGATGSAISTLHLSLGLAERGVDIGLACPAGSELEADARAAGLGVFPLSARSNRFLPVARGLARLLAENAFDLVNSQSTPDRRALTWLGLTRRLPIPLVVTRRQMPRTAWPENWLVGQAAARLIAVSPAVAEVLSRRGIPRSKLAVVPNGLVLARVDRPVAAREVDEWRARIGWQAGQRTLVIVSRPKAQDVVLKALARVETPIRLVLAGAGETAFESLLRDVPTRHTVIRLGFLPDVRPLYDLAEIALLPTHDEGLSQALLEALALGIPVIASDRPGNRFVIRDGVNGYLVPLAAPEQWALAIARLLASTPLCRQVGEAGRHTARDEFSLERTIEGTLAVYRAVLG
jgi:glycosyltransferase involved in cell wall biosynthesis